MLSPITRRAGWRFAAPVGLLAMAVTLALPTLAHAHAELVESEPVANASLDGAPTKISLAFSEPVDEELAFVDLIDARQQPVAGLGPVRILDDGRNVVVDLPELDPGIYTVTYQVVSTVDGHATTGIFAFVIDPTGTEAPPPIPPAMSTPSVDGTALAARWLSLAGALVSFGSLILWWRSRPLLGAGPGAGPPWRLVALASALAFVGIAAYLSIAARPIVEAIPERGAGFPLDFAAPFGSTPFAIAMRVALAGTLIAAILALIAAGRSRGPRIGLLFVMTSLALAIALIGMSMAAHAAALGGPIAAAFDWLHLVAVAAWLGGLPAVAVLARRSTPGNGTTGERGMRILRRHGATALVAAPLVVLTGVANSPLVLGQARDLVASEYGNLLLAKALLVSLALAIGAANHFMVRRRGRRGVAALVAAEFVVALVAVSVAATMVTVQTSAARQPVLAATPVNPAHLFGEAGPTRVHATINLPVPGTQSYQVTATDLESGAPRDDIQLVYLTLVPPHSAELPDQRVPLTRDADRPELWTASGAFMPIEGEWEVSVVVRRTGALDEAALFTVPVAQPDPPRLVAPPDTGVEIPAPLGLLWGLVPAGPIGWLPAAIGIVGLALLGPRGMRRPGVARGLLRGALVAVVLASGLGAGSRLLVQAANAPSAEALAEHRPDPSFDTSIERGEVVYLANCAACHGRDGRGDGPVQTIPRAEPLDAPVSRMSSAELSYRIAHGLAGTSMPAFATSLTDAERRDLVSYLEDRWR